MPYEDFTTYTETDPNGHINVASATHVDVDGLTRGEDAYLYADKGANHFDDFEHLIDIKPVSGTSWSYGLAWMMANVVDDWTGIKNASGVAIGVQLFRLGDTTRAIKVVETYGGANYGGNNLTITLDTQYYARVKKDGTTFYVRLWTNATDRDNDDIEADSYVGESSYTLHADHTFRYIFAVNSYNDNQSAQTATFDVDNLDLQEGGATYTKTWTTDSLFKKLGITKTAAIDVAFKKPNIQIQRQVDALFKKFDILKTFGADVGFLKKDVVRSFAVDARFGALVTYTISRQIDVLFEKLGVTRTFGVDAYFGAVGAVAYTRSFALDVVFAYKVRLPELWLDEEGRIVLNVSRPYVWVGS